MHQLQIPVGDMPVNLILLYNQQTAQRFVAFVKVAQFEALLDQSEDGEYVGAFFYPEGFTLFRSEVEAVDFEYNTAYAYYQIPPMLKWLQQQNLQLPIVIM